MKPSCHFGVIALSTWLGWPLVVDAQDEIDPSAAAISQDTERAVLSETDKFNWRFGSITNVEEYVAIIDSLVRVARQRPCNSPQEAIAQFSSGDMPVVNSTNGVKIIYTIGLDQDRVWHYLSFSGRYYVAATNAKQLACLFSQISGLPIPETLCVSRHNVYHVEWVLERSEHDRLQTYMNPDLGAPEILKAKALLRGMRIQIAPLEAPLEKE